MLPQIRALWRQLTAVELHPENTAIVLHWPGGTTPDLTFVFPRLLQGPPLDTILDALLEEHVPATDGSQEVLTEITLFWHNADGAWDMEELLSHYYPTETSDAEPLR